MRLIGSFILLLGILALAAGVLSLPFTGIYLIGFIGTGGREAGGELLMFLPATLLLGGAGFVFLKLGIWLRKAK